MSSVWSSVSSSKPFSKFFQHQSPQSLQVACAGQVGASANQLPGPAFRLDRPIGARSATVRFRCFVDLPQGGPLPRPSGPTGGSQRVWVILTSHDGLHAVSRPPTSLKRPLASTPGLGTGSKRRDRPPKHWSPPPALTRGKPSASSRLGKWTPWPLAEASRCLMFRMSRCRLRRTSELRVVLLPLR